MEPDFRPEEVNNGWIAFFFDKVKDVSEDYMKEIWSKLLAGEFNEPGTYTKQFLNLMSLMDSNIAKRFQKIRSSCFYAEPFLYSIIYRNNGGNINNIKRYEKMGIFIKDFRELENFGLIQYKFASFHTWQIKNRTFCYGDKRIRLDTNKKLTALGNVALTDAGKQLCRIVPMEYDGRMLEICLEAWEELGYNPVLEFMEE